MKIEDTLIIIKPDALSKRITGRVIRKIEEDTDLKITGMKMTLVSVNKAEKFYAEHREKDFYRPLVNFISSNPVIALAVTGESAIEKMRKLIGGTHPDDAEEGTIRSLWAQDGRYNIIHGSDSPESARREMEFFFPAGKGIYRWKEKEYPLK